MTWSRVRAVAIALHIVAVLVAALPPTSDLLDRSAWKSPSVQDEFAAWADRLSLFGGTWTSAALEDRLWTVVQGYATVLTVVQAPVRPYQQHLGVRQGWQMFAAADRHPAVLTIDVERDGRWETVFVERSATHDWRRAFFEADRVRTIVYRFSWPHLRRHRAWKAFGDHLVPWLAADHPDATRARLRYRRARTPTPAEVLAGRQPPHRFEGTRVLELP
jgi:hypothetical protein